MAESVRAIPPGGTIGIMGGGQLGRMLAIAAAEMGYQTHIFTSETDSPASHVASKTTVGAYDDLAAVAAFAAQVDVITIEFENIPSAGLWHVADKVPCRPHPRVLETCQHRVKEKDFIGSLGIGTAPYRSASDLDKLKAAAKAVGLPAIAKTCRMGYDGKGQAAIRAESELEAAWAKLRTDDAILEGFVDFVMEVSVIVARNPNGESKAYPVVENVHRDHILYQTIAPARVDELLKKEANRIALAIAEGIGLEGLLAIEMFVTRDGKVLVNELAPRPHNSGHWTLDACPVSQFEQTVRAVCNLPLGSVDPLCPAVMTNLLGDEINGWPEILKNPLAKLHLYGKREPKPGRKMGHFTELKPNA